MNARFAQKQLPRNPNQQDRSTEDRMSTNTSSALDQPPRTTPTPKLLSDKVITNGLTRPHVEPFSANPPAQSARQTLITAITQRIAHQRLSAAQTAVALQLTGPRTTHLLEANVDEFTLDELVNLLPALDLVLHVVPAPQEDVRRIA